MQTQLTIFAIKHVTNDEFEFLLHQIKVVNFQMLPIIL